MRPPRPKERGVSRKFLKDKRGVSPLIATVLLIAFAVALGAVVMNWGRSYVSEEVADVQQATASMDCSGAIIGVATISDKTKICANTTSGTISMILENNGDKIAGIKLTVLGEKGVDNPLNLVNTEMERAATMSENVPYDKNEVGDQVQQIKIIPKIRSNGKETYCAQSAITMNYVEECK
jgi:flagellin-like protein